MRPTAFDGYAIGAGTDYDARFLAADEYPRSIQLGVEGRENQVPLVTSVRRDGRTLPLFIARAVGAGITSAVFHANVNQWFSPAVDAADTRLLELVGVDGVTALEGEVYVVSIRPVPRTVDQYRVELFAPNDVFSAAVDTTNTGGTIDNVGNVAALPVVALATTTHVSWRQCTVAGAGAAGGLISYPVRFDLLDAAATLNNTFVFVNGISVPTRVIDSGGANSVVWVVLDTKPDGSTTPVDIVYGAGLVNPLGQTLDDGGMDMSAGAVAAMTNTQWQWNDLRVSRSPGRCGCWRPGKTGRHDAGGSLSYRIAAEAFGAVSFQLGESGEYANDADSMVLMVGSEAGTTNALANLTRTTTLFDGINARAYVRYQVANTQTWLQAWATRSNATDSTSIDLDNAVRIAVGVENDSATLDDGATLEVSGAGVGGVFQLALTSTPTVVVGAVANMDHYDGTFRIGGVGSPEIVFADFLVADGTLTVDAREGSVVSSVATAPMYGGFSPSDDPWLEVAPGVQAISNTTGGTYTVTIRAASS